jgi:hypothetical protein
MIIQVAVPPLVRAPIAQSQGVSLGLVTRPHFAEVART